MCGSNVIEIRKFHTQCYFLLPAQCNATRVQRNAQRATQHLITGTRSEPGEYRFAF